MQILKVSVHNGRGDLAQNSILDTTITASLKYYIFLTSAIRAQTEALARVKVSLSQHLVQIYFKCSLKLAQAACVRCNGTKCPLLTAISSSSLWESYFSPRRGYCRVPKFCMGL